MDVSRSGNLGTKQRTCRWAGDVAAARARSAGTIWRNPPSVGKRGHLRPARSRRSWGVRVSRRHGSKAKPVLAWAAVARGGDDIGLGSSLSSPTNSVFVRLRFLPAHQHLSFLSLPSTRPETARSSCRAPQLTLDQLPIRPRPTEIAVEPPTESLPPHGSSTSM